MDLQAFSQVLYDADARHLVALLNTADVPTTGRQEHVFLGHAPGGAQLLQRTTEVSVGRNILSRHCLDFRAMGLERPLPTSLIGWPKR